MPFLRRIPNETSNSKMVFKNIFSCNGFFLHRSFCVAFGVVASETTSYLQNYYKHSNYYYKYYCGDCTWKFYKDNSELLQTDVCLLK